MNTLVIFNLLLVLGLGFIQAVPVEEYNGFMRGIQEEINRALQGPRSAVRRVVREAIFNLGEAALLLESAIIDNCNSNSGSESLQATYDNMKTCFRRKIVYIASKSEYLAHIDECAAKAVRETKNCLPEEKKYFPEFILDVAKSLVSFTYDNFQLLRGEVASCLPNIETSSATISYMSCLRRTSEETNDSDQIPNSKASFCQIFIAISYCYTNMLRDVCVQTTNMNKFREDYINAMKRPCNNNLDGPAF